MKVARHRGMKKAIVALARRLAVIMDRIWVDGTEFRDQGGHRSVGLAGARGRRSLASSWPT
jgi:hypothetical protein